MIKICKLICIMLESESVESEELKLVIGDWLFR